MENNLRIWEPARGILHDTDTNMNFIDLRQPYEAYAQPIYPREYPQVKDPVRHFRKVLLWTTYSKLLQYLTVDPNGNVKVGKDKSDKHFSEKMHYLLKTFASKKNVKSIMEKLSRQSVTQPMTFSQFYDAVYEKIRSRIKKQL